MRWLHSFVSLSLGFVLVACPTPGPPAGPPTNLTDFQTAQDINGINAAAVNTAIFGVFKTDDNQDGIIDQTVLEILSSSQTDICDRVAAGEFNGFDAIPEGTHVDIVIVANNDLAAGTIDAGNTFILSVGLLSVQDGITQLTAFTDLVSLDATITLAQLDAITAKGNLTSTLAEDSTDINNIIAIDVALEGTFDAAHCQALSDQLAQN
jgi:FlaG/FlaF family flagellin (archaellin)